MTGNAGSLAARLCKAPKPADLRAARSRLGDLLEDDEKLATLAHQPPVRDLLLGIADHSTFLWRLMRRVPARLSGFLEQAPEHAFQQILSDMSGACDTANSEEQVMQCLRMAKQSAALLIALADLGGVWDVVAVTQALSQFADAAVSGALRYLLRAAANDGKLVLRDAQAPETGCGVVVLAMGKHGACELNYSSDIDLIVFYDPETSAVPKGQEPSTIFVRMTRALAKILQERTGDGYVLRVDLRLRPDPGSTAVAISLPAAFSYYEMLGQNWERAALIKARPVAGDKPLGAALLGELAPFIWRKYFDYAAIADIHAMKRQIHAVRGHAEVAVAGHDVKLGRGGIREVEFFVQTQQLIFGGRRLQLRGARTLDMLVALQADGWVTQEAVDDLSAAYKFLRAIEHRLQMIADEQTQRLPSDPEALKRFAKFCGYAGLPAFEKALTRNLKLVERHYARLFEHAPGLAAGAGSLVFTGVADDPETLKTLAGLGFQDPARAAETIRGWHFGRRPAVQSPRAREVLTELVPALLESFSGSGDADAALDAFDAALMRMPAAVELFSILRANDSVRDLFGDILGGAPRLARVVATRPHVLDAAIDPALLQAPADETAYDARAGALLETAGSTEEFLDGMRDLAQEEMFLIGVRTLSHILDPLDAGRAYAALAGSVLRASLAHVARVFVAEYGCVPGGRCAVLAMGKFGSREMTAASDLDLVLIYDFDEASPESDGARRLHATQYYTRLTQRLVSSLTVATRRGRLYDVDTRLRPSGRQGPAATQLRSFMAYQLQEAETWEHMALTRARVVAGDRSLGADLQSTITRVLRQTRHAQALRQSVREMRAMIAREKGESDPWDLKLAAGGVIDIEFVAQYLALRHGAEHPDLLAVETAQVLAQAGRCGLISADDADRLVAAHRLYSTVMQMMRLTIDGPFEPGKAARGVLRRIAAAADCPDFSRLERQLLETRGSVRALFRQLLG